MHQTVKTPPVAPEVARKRRARRKRYIIFGSIGLVLLLIIASVVASKREKPIPVTTEKAVRKTILQTVSATGKIQPETEVKISPEVAGEIIELPVEDGMQVKKGDLLVKIKPDSYKALLEQQEAAISAAKATNLQQKATMLKSEHDFKRAEDLFNKKLISEQEFNAAQAAYDVAKNTLKVPCTKLSGRRPARVRLATNYRRQQSTRLLMAPSRSSTANWANVSSP